MPPMKFTTADGKTVILSIADQIRIRENLEINEIIEEMVKLISIRNMKIAFNTKTDAEMVAKSVNVLIKEKEMSKSIAIQTILNDTEFIQQFTHYHNSEEHVNMSVADYNNRFLPMIDKANYFISRLDSAIDHMDHHKVDKDEVRRILALYNYDGETIHIIRTALEYYKQHEGLKKLEGYTDVILDKENNLMTCWCCRQPIGSACDWTPNYCPECGSMLTGGNGKGPYYDNKEDTNG